MESGGEITEVDNFKDHRGTIDVVRDYTVSQDSPVILVNPSHGNEPFIMGTAFAQGVSQKLAEKGLPRAKIVVPLMYG